VSGRQSIARWRRWRRASPGSQAGRRCKTAPVPVDDVISPDELSQFADALYAIVRGWLRASVQVHLLLAGGRKSMAMVGMSVAQLLLGPEGCVRYRYSDEGLRIFDSRFGQRMARIVSADL
jgi:hypothetical protein